MFWIIAIIVIAALIAVRAMLWEQRRRMWKPVFETSSRTDGVAHDIDRELRRNNVRSKLVYKGPANFPFIGISGEQMIAVEVHAQDIELARPIVSRVLNEDWRGRV
jgi:hypothetical protein